MQETAHAKTALVAGNWGGPTVRPEKRPTPHHRRMELLPQRLNVPVGPCGPSSSKLTASRVLSSTVSAPEDQLGSSWCRPGSPR